MKRFLFWTAAFFGIFLTIYTVRIMVREKDMAKVNVREVKGKTFTIMSPDLFAERNIMDVFSKRYSAQLKFSFQNDLANYFDIKTDSDALIYPSFAFDNLYSSQTILPLDLEKIANIKTLMDDTKSEINNRYTKNGKTYAIPVAYVPYAMFYDKNQLKESTVAREIISTAPSISFADSFGSLLFMLKVYGLPLSESSVSQVKKLLKGKVVTYFNADDPFAMEKALNEAKPKLIIGPSYCKNILEREFGSFDMILPKEGTYADYYLVSLLKNEKGELSHVFLNHLVEPLIHRNLVEVMGIGITNYAAMSNITPVLYNGLKMNDPAYLKSIFKLNNKQEFELAKTIFAKMKD